MKGELLKEYCKLVNETFGFVKENFENIVPAGRRDPGIFLWTKDIYKKAERLLSEDKTEELEDLAENYLKYAKEYYLCGTPGQIMKNDRRTCCHTILNTVQLVANLSVLMDALGCSQAAEVMKALNMERTWTIQNVHSGFEVIWNGYSIEEETV